MRSLLTAFLILIPSFALAQITSTGYELPTLRLSPMGSNSQIDTGVSQEIGKFRIQNPSRKSILLQSIRLKNNGTANLSRTLENAAVYQNNERVSSHFRVDRSYITFSFSPAHVIRGGDSHILSLKANVVYAQRGDTIQLALKREEDLFATEWSSGFQVPTSTFSFPERSLDIGSLGVSRNRYSPYRFSRYNRSRNSTSHQSSRTKYRSRFSGSNRYSRASRRSPRYRSSGSFALTNQQFSPGARDIVFLKFHLRGKVGMAAEGATFYVSSQSKASDKDGNGSDNEREDFSRTFSDFRLFVNGDLVDSANDFDEIGGNLALEFDGNMEMMPGSQVLVVGRTTHQAVTGDKLKLNFSTKDFHDPTYLYNRSSVPSSNRNGNVNSREVQVGE